MGTISGAIHMKTIFSFSPGTGISLVTHSAALTILSRTHSHFALFRVKQCLLQSPTIKYTQESRLENVGVKDQETPSGPNGKRTGRDTILNELAYNLMPASISEI
jgi:hypothetical protein